MRHHNTVFHDILKHIPWGKFDDLVDQHGSDHRVRRLSSKDQFIALLYGQLSGAQSLREITSGLRSHEARLYHVGSRPVSRSTLADANAKRSSAVFSDLFAEMVRGSHRRVRRSMGNAATYLIDSTGVRLSGLSADWARFSEGVHGAKVHVIYDADEARPVYHTVTPSRVNDITAAQDMPIEAGATYVFDLGYFDCSWWAKLDAAGCRIVTRFKVNTPLKVTRELEVPEGSHILSDRIGLLTARRSRGRKNPFSNPVREVRVKTDTGKVLRILCNDLAASAQEIADLYKRRWAIELFFKWVKQTLKIKHFLGTSENAVRIQIAVAMIVYLLIKLAHSTQSAIDKPLTLARLIRVNLMHKKRIDRLLEPEPTPSKLDLQMALI